MRILVTGATGQLGAALTRRLQSYGSIIPTTREALDLSKPETIPAALDRIAPDIIINSAAFTAVNKAEEEPFLARLVNADAPGMMAWWAAKQAAPMIHFSTDYVFDGSGKVPWHEDDVPRPLSVYGMTKLAGEERVRFAKGAFLIVRTSWVFAAKGTNFLRTIAHLASSRTELQVVSDQVGAPTSAAFLADSIAALLRQGLPSFLLRATQAKGLVHLACCGEASWHLFAEEIVSGLRTRGIPLAVERMTPVSTADYPQPAQRPLNSRLSLERWRYIGSTAIPHWKEALEPELDLLASELALTFGS